MKKQLLLIGALLSQLSFGNATSKVFNGESVASGWYPWQVLLIRQPEGLGVCGGTLIAPQWVLTAAHCVAKKGRVISAGDIAVALGDTRRSQLRNRMMPVSEIIVHEGYDRNKEAAPDDIALLKLSRSASQVPVRLAINPLWGRQPDHRLKVMGWGRTESGNLAEQLQITDISIVDERYCQNYFQGAYSHGQLCVGDLAGIKDSCGGDSGGPLFRGIGEKAIQYGIVSFGDEQCASKNKPAVYASVADYIGWIKQQMGRDAGQLQLVDERSDDLVVPRNVAKGKRALLIGVNKYYLGGHLNLGGTETDVDNMKRLLIEKFAFKPEQIMTLKSEQATAKNIRQAVREWLIGQTGAGDKVWLYFSGHGAFLPDTSGDEIEVDAQIGIPADETILPYDTDMLTQQNVGSGTVIYTMNHLLDDEINQWTQKLKDRQLTVMFDSCHSGTATRAFSTDRTKSGILAMKNWMNDKLGSSASFAPAVLPKGTSMPQKNHVENVNKNMIFWAAASSAEQARDSAQGGLFTIAFVEGVRGKADKNKDGHISYAELLDYVRSEVKMHQPQLEISSSRLQESIFSRDIVGEPVETASQVLSNNNPHGLALEWLDMNMHPAKSLRVCREGDCPKYKLRISAKRDGWLLLYDLEDNGHLQQYVPNHRHELLEKGVFLRAGEPFIFPVNFKMHSSVPSTLVAILLDPVERGNYDKIKYQLAEQTHAEQGFFYNVINRRDSVIDEDGTPAQLSVKMKYYSPE